MFSQPFTILIINDNPEDRLTFQRYLKKYNQQNYQVLEASSGREGLQILKTVQVDGILLDFFLPDLDSIQFLQQLKNQFFYTNFAVIILTEMVNENLAVEVMKNGAQDYLVKDNLTPETLHKSLYLSIERVKLRRDLEKSEQRFRATFEQAAVGIYHVNLVGEFLDFNQKFCKIVGNLPEEIEQKTLEEIIFYEDLPNYKEQVKRLLNNQIETFTLEQRFLKGDNLSVWVNLTVSVVNKKNGKPDYLMGIVEDIQNRKLTEIKLKKANQQLKNIVEQLAKQNQERTLLSRVSQYLQSCNSLQEAYQILADLIQPLFTDCSLGIYELNDQQTIASLVSYSGTNLNSKDLFDFSDCWALRQGKAHYNQIHYPKLFCSHVDSNKNTKATLCYPIIAQGKNLGILHISATDENKLTPEQEILAETVSDYITLSLVNLKLQEELKEQSIRDALTGLFNRRYLYEFLNKEISQAQRYDTEIGVILMDIDHFKQINDNYTHSLGDVVLEEISRFLRENIRESDIACRYGGEEFILIFPHASLDNTYQRAETLRKNIKRLHFQYQKYRLESITISIGVANFPQHGLTGDELVHSADIALYAAKDEGRDRTIIYNDSLPKKEK